MSQIPTPCKKKKVKADPSVRFLQQWKNLFNSIDPQHITATIRGEADFPEHFDMNESRLYDHYETEVKVHIELKGHHLIDLFGQEIYCCKWDKAFGSGWIYTDDVNYDSLHHEQIQWQEVYARLVKLTLNYHKQIPVPPKMVT